jgi:hypothetical protein
VRKKKKKNGKEWKEDQSAATMTSNELFPVIFRSQSRRPVSTLTFEGFRTAFFFRPFFSHKRKRQGSEAKAQKRK